MTTGQPLTVRILVTSTNCVKVDDISPTYDKRRVDINKILTDLQRQQQSTGNNEGRTETISVTSTTNNNVAAEVKMYVEEASPCESFEKNAIMVINEIAMANG